MVSLNKGIKFVTLTTESDLPINLANAAAYGSNFYKESTCSVFYLTVDLYSYLVHVFIN